MNKHFQASLASPRMGGLYFTAGVCKSAIKYPSTEVRGCGLYRFPDAIYYIIKRAPDLRENIYDISDDGLSHAVYL